MKINISGLSEGSHSYEFAETAVELGLTDGFSGNVSAQVTLEKSVHQIHAIVNASVKGVFICDRCADEFEDVVRTTFTSIYSWEQGEEQTEEDDDFHILRKEDSIIDLSASVREYLTLSVPVKLLCKKNCEIPGHVQAADDGSDPRWEKLKTLLHSEKN